jgi:GT2 family glycosyltransferase
VRSETSDATTNFHPTNSSNASVPKAVVLILSYNGKELLEDSIRTYLTSEYSNFEVAVIDNGSKDGTAEYMRETWPHVKLIFMPENKGYSGGFIVGLKVAFGEMGADYVLITNNDVIADSKALPSLIRAAQTDPMIGFVTGKVYYAEDPNRLQTVGYFPHPIRWKAGHIGHREIDNGQHDQPAYREFIDDIYMLTTKEVYAKEPGYDPLFFLQCEQYDWQARAMRHGFKCYYTPDAKIWHKESMTIGKTSPMKAYHDSRNQLLVHMRNRPADKFKKFFWWYFPQQIIRNSLIALKNKDNKKFNAIWRGFFDAMKWGRQNKKLTLKHFV